MITRVDMVQIIKTISPLQQMIRLWWNLVTIKHSGLVFRMLTHLLKWSFMLLDLLVIMIMFSFDSVCRLGWRHYEGKYNVHIMCLFKYSCLILSPGLTVAITVFACWKLPFLVVGVTIVDIAIWMVRCLTFSDIIDTLDTPL